MNTAVELQKGDPRKLIVWEWVKAQSDRYRDSQDLEGFLNWNDPRQRDFLILAGDEPIGMMVLYLRENGICEIGVMTPPGKRKIFSLLSVLKLMQDSYFESFGNLLYCETDHKDTGRMAKILGWNQVSSNRWEKQQ